MKLTAIQLNGFKSFAENTLFPVNVPVTGIIGPNGCGKSNIIDAVRWVLGESTAKQLRGKLISDVIFTGSTLRKQAGMASVCLHFNNKDGKASGNFAAYSEIIIQRKMTSDGQSEYRINKQRCRRKDVVELMQGTGISARSYAVIEQGMVSRIVEAKPEDLRVFLEEAAGIALYRTRRQESLNQLNQVQMNVTRFEDIIYSLEKQTISLKQEAEIAKKFRDIEAKAKFSERKLYSVQLHNIVLEIARTKEEFHGTENLKTVLYEDYQRQQWQNTEQQTILNQLKFDINQIHQQKMAASKKYYDLEKQYQEHRFRIENRQEKFAEYKEQLAQLKNQEQQLKTESAELKHLLQTMMSNICAAKEVENKHTAEYEICAEQLNAHQQAQKLKQQKELQLQNEMLRLQNEKNKHIQRLEALQQGKSLSSLPSIGQEISQEKIEIAILQKENYEDDSAEMEADIQIKNLSLLDKETHLEKLVQDNHLLQQSISHKQSRLHTIKELLPKKTTSNAVKASVNPKLFEVLSIEPHWQAALEKVLAPALHAEVTNSLALQTLGAGEIPTQWQNIIHNQLALGCFLAHLYPLAIHDDAVDSESLLPNQYYLTLSGSIVGQGFFIHLENVEGLQGILSHIAEVAELEAELEQLEINSNDFSQEITDLKQEISQFQNQIQLKKQQQLTLLSKMNTLDKSIMMMENQLSHLAWEKQQWQMQQEQFSEDIKICEKNIEEVDADIELLVKETNTQVVETSDKVLAQLSSALAEKKNQQQFSQNHHQELEREHVRLQTMLTNKASLLKHNESSLAKHEEAIKNIQETLNKEHAQQNSLEKSFSEAKNLFDYLSNNYVDQDNHLQNVTQNYEAALQKVMRLENELKMVQEKLSVKLIQLQQLDKQRQDKQQYFEDEGTSPIELANDESFDEFNMKTSLREIKKQLSDFGEVNLTAIHSYESIKKELENNQNQCSDLKQCIKLLEESIDTLDNETREKLSTTLTTVNESFSSFFPILFHGGEAQIAWTEGDILQAGLEIVVRPPGKKVKNLNSLSGGEKALTAVALIFALFALHPAPFCLLDEIDAPLDDANVERLCFLLRKMSENTQFIMITHRKRSMEFCDHLIGVTMSEPGVSRIVAVQFDQPMTEAI